METSEQDSKGIIVVIGDKVKGLADLLSVTRPTVVGFLTYTKKGLENATDLARCGFPEMRNCDYGTIHDTRNKLEFFSKMNRLRNFIEEVNLADFHGIAVGTENLEILAHSAICAHQARTNLLILDGGRVLIVDSHEARLIDSLLAITKAFNLHQYAEVSEEISMIRRDFKTSKIKIYFEVFARLAEAYAKWDERVFLETSKKLQDTLDLLKDNAGDFGNMGLDYQERIADQIGFIEKLSSKDPILKYLFGTIDALCNGVRKYEKGDYLVGLLTIANSIEYCVRTRLLMKGYDIEEPSKLNKRLLKEYPEKAREYLLSSGEVSLNKESLKIHEDEIMGILKPGFTHKPAFTDMLRLLGFLNDELFDELSPLIGDSTEGNFLTLKGLNTLRNKVVHNMGSVDKEQVENAMKLARYVLEKFINVISKEYESQIPSESEEETRLRALEKQASHVSLDYKELLAALFTWG